MQAFVTQAFKGFFSSQYSYFVKHHVFYFIHKYVVYKCYFLKSQRSTYLCRTAISFSMLFSFPSNAFLGIHLIATNFWVLFSSARTTSEKAPLKHKHAGQTVRPRYIYPRVLRQSCVTVWKEKRKKKKNSYSKLVQTFVITWQHATKCW